MEYGERHSLPHPGECIWLGQDLTLNTGGRYILIFPEVLITLTQYDIQLFQSRDHIIRLLRGGYYNLNMLRTFSARMQLSPS